MRDEQKHRVISSFKLLKQALNPALNYLVFVRETKKKENVGFKEALIVLNQLNINVMGREIYLDEEKNRAYMVLNLKDSKMEVGHQELLGSLLPEDITYYYYRSKKQD
jgi:hypothetical protein